MSPRDNQAPQPEKQKPPEPVLSYRPDRAAQVLGVSRSTLYKLMKEGILRFRQVGGLRLIPMAEIERFLSLESLR
jgi:excisionase family DNA binding protein